jgi:hypothetical protein
MHITRFAIGTTIATVVLHALASWLDWYELFPWFDILMHTLGGAWVASIVLCVARVRNLPFFTSNRVWIHILVTVALTALIGIWWEFFEYALFTVIAHVPQPPGLYEDTLLDLLMDTIGGLFVALTTLRKKS